ncbi:DNA-protecting protein DprA [Candidatus Dependentiae bacterium]|nr:DNA-protecting protein DprA [Candidatus Dependentiae bacterium]
MMFDKNREVLLHLSLIKNIGPKIVLKIIKKYLKDSFINYKHPEIVLPKINLSKIYKYRIKDFIINFNLSEKMAAVLFNGLQKKDDLNREIKLIEKYKIDIITFLDDDYPDELKQIYSPPIILYCKGLGLSNFKYKKRISIVGARKANMYARTIINNLVSSLINNNYSIVSGGAIGVDSMAHLAAINFKGNTIVVLGSGLLCPYPEVNKDLFRNIIKSGGTLLSPFPLNTKPLKGNFPARNRIIAGLGVGCLVIQAAKKSGALITAQFALDEGRQVFAVPGDINDELSLGCHELIKQGAKIVSSIDDVLEEFGETNLDQKLEKKVCINKNFQENLILKNLKFPISADELSVKIGLDFNSLQEKLFDMELQGIIKQNIAGLWEII